MNYIEDNRDYIDADVNTGNTGSSIQTAGVRKVSWAEDDQFHTGILNYGFSEPVYHQFSGESIFEDGASLGGIPFLNYAWTNLNQLQFKVPAAWAYGAEFQYYSSTSESAYGGDKDDVEGSSIDMRLFMLSLNVKAFILDPVDERLQPYLGVGWGVLGGSFDTTQTETKKHFSTSFLGLYSYQMIGVQVMIKNNWGIVAEFKNLRGSAPTSNDPFSQGNNDSVDLAFDGAIIGLSFYYRM